MKEDNSELESAIERLASRGLTRRQALTAIVASGAGLAVSPLLSKLAWAGESLNKIPLARPDKPVKLPMQGEPIKDGLKPESGTFNVFNYADYLSKDVLDTFGEKYDVDVKLTTFGNQEQAISRLANHDVDVDVTELLSEKVARAAVGRLLRPLNHSYIPNLKQNVWTGLQNPFYDQGSRYTVPYVCYTTGIGWRSDKVKEDIPNMDNPWSIFWKAQAYKGYVALISEVRLAVGLALLYRGNTNLNTVNPDAIDKAEKDLKDLIKICDPKANETGFQTLASGKSWLHQAWSGDLLQNAMFYLPKGQSPKVLQYWAAPKGKGPIQNDCWAVVASSKKPVLAHLWLNFILKEKNAYSNFVNFLGYQPPIKGIDASKLISKGVIPENLRSAVVSPDDFGPDSAQYCTLTNKGLRIWQKAYSAFISGT